MNLHDLNKNRLEPCQRRHSFDDSCYPPSLLSVQDLYEVQRRLWRWPPYWNEPRRVVRYEDWYRGAQP